MIDHEHRPCYYGRSQCNVSTNFRFASGLTIRLNFVDVLAHI